MTTRKHRPTIIGIGEILWDLLPGGRLLGGAPTNFAYYAHALGARTFVASCVGRDPLGADILTELQTLGIPTDHVSRHAALPTGTVSVHLSPDGQPSYEIHMPVAWDAIPTTDALLAVAQEADAVCFGSLAQRQSASRATIREILRATRLDALRIFDVNLRGTFYDAGVIDQSLQAANVMKLNDEELQVVCDLLGVRGDENERIRRIMDLYDLSVAALTKGAAGSVLFDGNQVSVHDGIPTQVADTVGAGDAFTAALAVGLLDGQPLDALHDHAARIAAHACSRPGATHPLPPELT